MQQTQRHLRRCRNSEAVMWICPHLYIDHGLIHRLRAIDLGQLPTCRDQSHQIQISHDEIQLQRPIRHLHNGQTKIPYHELKHLMKSRHIHLCPHLLLSSKKVYKSAKQQSSATLFSLPLLHRIKESLTTVAKTSKTQLKNLGRSTNPAQSNNTSDSTCTECTTHWHWSLDQNTSILSIIITRPFVSPNSGLGVNNPTWIAQTVPPEDIRALKKQWDKDVYVFGKLEEEYRVKDDGAIEINGDGNGIRGRFGGRGGYCRLDG
ncbi:MAG: hypothetical protein Q9221_002309 [Calogaya cf. arnoldii]